MPQPKLSKQDAQDLFDGVDRPMLMVGMLPNDAVVYFMQLDDEGDFARVMCRLVQHWAKGKGYTDEHAWQLVRREWKHPTHKGGVTFELDKGDE